MLTREDLFNLYQQTVNKIETDYQRGALTENEAQFNLQNVHAEFTESLATLDGVEEDEYDYDFNDFGETLLAAGEAEGYDDIGEYLSDLSQLSGLDIDFIAEVITSEEEPNEDFAEAFIDTITGEYDADYDEDEYDDDDDEYEYEDDDEEVDPELVATYSRVNQLEDQIAEFQAVSIVGDALNKYKNLAQELVENGDMPPVAYRVLFTHEGRELDNSDQIAAFSQLAEANQVGIDTELYALDKVLNLFSQMGLGNLGLFNQVVEDEIAEFEKDEDAEAEDLARSSIELRKKRKLGLI